MSPALRQDQAFEELRRILLSEDLARLSALEENLAEVKEQLNQKEQLIAALRPVISEVLEQQIDQSREEMAAALSPIMGSAIRHQIQNAKEDIVDALYPIIGKTVRKSVAEAVRNLADNINRKIESALRANPIRKRLSARISGVSAHELILRQALPFSVNDIYLIHRDSGLVMAHASAVPEGEGVNRDLVSGMLSAIQSFADEVFKADAEQDLNAIQYGDQTIIIHTAYSFYLAFVVQGITSDTFTTQAEDLVAYIQGEYQSEIRQFSGDTSPFHAVRPKLEVLLRGRESSETETEEAPGPAGMRFLAAVLLLVLLFFGGRYVISKFSKAVTQRKITAVLIRDPAYSNVNLKSIGSGWRLSGSVPDRNVLNRLDSLLFAELPELDVDKQVGTESEAARLERAIEDRVSPYVQDGRLQLRLHLAEGNVTLEGFAADAGLKHLVGSAAGEIRGVESVYNNLGVMLSESELASQQTNIGRPLFYNVGTARLTGDQRVQLDSLALWLLSHPYVSLDILGYSDPQGSRSVNLNLSHERAMTVWHHLLDQGVQTDQMRLQCFGALKSEAEDHNILRRVELKLSVRKSP